MRKALVILTPGFPENEQDSTCIPPQQTFVQTLQRLYPDRQIVVLSFIYPFFTGAYDWHGVKVMSFGKPGAGRLHRKFTYLNVWRALLQLRGEYEIQGLLAFWLGPCAWLGSHFAAWYRLVFHTWLLGQDARPGNKYVRKIKPAASGLLALSDFVAAEFEKNYGIRPAFVVPPGIDPVLFSATTVEKDIDIIGVGSLISLKQFDLFIDVIAKLKQSFPGLRAIICGEGPQRAGLEKHAWQRGLTENEISFTGRLPHGEVLRLMQRSRVLLHTSGYEGFGVVQLEALYSGASVVSFVQPMNKPVEGWFPVAGITEMIDRLTYLLSKPDVNPEPRLPFLLEDAARRVNQFFEAPSACAPLTDSNAAPVVVSTLSEAGRSVKAIS